MRLLEDFVTCAKASLNLHQFVDEFFQQLKQTTLLEYIAVIAGIASVWFSRIENILVYPVGLISTIIYVYLSIEGDLFGEAAVNLYFTIMSIYGWILWAKKDQQHHHLVNISFSNRKELVFQLLFFAGFYVVIYITLKFLQGSFGVIPWADALASAAAFTGMWLMARKKVESWYWWMATNIASIPLYFVKDFKLTSLYYLILLIMAVFGLREWQRRAREHDYKEFLPET